MNAKTKTPKLPVLPVEPKQLIVKKKKLTESEKAMMSILLKAM
jgi:hypothetical protein